MKEYVKGIEDLHGSMSKQVEAGVMSEKQKKNWTTMKKLKRIVQKHLVEINERGLFQKTELTPKQFDLVQRYVVGSLYTLRLLNHILIVHIQYIPIKEKV